MMRDQANHIEVMWQDESHLSKYLPYPKSAKVIS